MLKESENPPTTWPKETSIRQFSGLWWAAHTKTRNEKALAWELARKGISYFLPMRWKVHYLRGRKLRSLLPLFSGYLFFCGTEQQRIEMLKTNRVVNLLEVNDQRKLLNELLKIEQAINAGAALFPHKYIERGQLCRVISGPMANLQGIIVRVGNASRLVLQIDMLGQAASVEIDADMIEIIDKN